MDATRSTPVYANAWMSVREDAVVRADGTAGIYGVVDKPTYALVIALRDDQLHLVEQYRYPLRARRWEFPQGTAPDRADLDPEQLAARELQEETGLRADTLTCLGILDVAPGMSSQRGHVYLATGLHAGPPQREAEEQDMRSEWWTRSALEQAIATGAISDSQSIAAYTLPLLYERRSDVERR